MAFEARTKALDCGDGTTIAHTAYYAPDGSYIGTKDWADRLAELGIMPQRRLPDSQTASIGFCEREQKWYGWSHRAIAGFGIGSAVKKGDCAYTATTADELIEDYVAFFADVSDPEETRATLKPDYENNRVWVGETRYPATMVSSADGVMLATECPEIMPKGEITMGGYWMNTGRGAWTAETLDDAKQMACDFAEGVD